MQYSTVGRSEKDPLPGKYSELKKFLQVIKGYLPTLGCLIRAVLDLEDPVITSGGGGGGVPLFPPFYLIFRL